MEHVHVSALAAFQTFLMVILVGFLWRLAAAHAAKSDSPVLSALGKGMASLY
jgi:hypothetical protein